MRTVRDTLGEMQVPDEALYAAQTARAIANFPVGGGPLPAPLVAALARIKGAWARVNATAVPADKRPMYDAIASAAADVAAGRYPDQFPVDVYQTGSGTSSNMNVNEVLASLASRALAATGLAVHPNDHVNRCQSSNDVFPTAIHLAVLEQHHAVLLPALEILRSSLDAKAAAFAAVVKVGRTHLMDATPVTLGQEFSGYAAQITRAIRVLAEAAAHLHELPLGGTAVGTGLQAPAPLVAQTVRLLAADYGLPLVEAANHFEAQAARDGLAFFSAALRNTAIALTKIANDIRWLASGPHCGLGEIRLPPTQPGSSIMPGKINPVQAESLLQVAARVIGNDATVAHAAASGAFELNTMMPVMAMAVLESIRLLGGVLPVFITRCLDGLEADSARCAELVEQSLALVTAIAPVIGYEEAARIAKRAAAEKRTLRELLREQPGLDPTLVDRLLDPAAMTVRPLDPGAAGAGGG